MNHRHVFSACCAFALSASLIAADTVAPTPAPAPAPGVTPPSAPTVRPMPMMPERYAVQLADLPEAGQKALKEEVTGKKSIAFIEKISRVKKEGTPVVTYRVEVAQEDGKLKTVILDAEGKVKNMPMPRIMPMGQPGQPGVPPKQPEPPKADDKADKPGL